MNTLAEYLTKSLIKNNIVGEEQREEYIYGFQLLLGKTLNYTTLLLVSLYFKVLVPGIVFMMVFLPLRGRTGGYHAKTSMWCYAATVVSYLVMIQVVAPVIQRRGYLYILIVVISVIVVFIFAPVNHPNLQLDRQEIQTCRQSSRWLVILITGCIWIAYAMQVKPICTTYAVMGLGMDAVLILMAKMTKQEVKESEEVRKNGVNSAGEGC